MAKALLHGARRQRNRKIVSLYRGGGKVAAIAQELLCSVQTVHGVLHKEGVPLRDQRPRLHTGFPAWHWLYAAIEHYETLGLRECAAWYRWLLQVHQSEVKRE